MNVKLDALKTGWFGVQIGMTRSEIETLIGHLKRIRDDRGHFHCHSTFQDTSGVADIQFSVVPDDCQGNMEIG